MTNPIPKSLGPGQVPKTYRVFNDQDVDAAQKTIQQLMGPRAPIYTERLKIAQAVLNAAAESAKRNGRTQHLSAKNLMTRQTLPYLAFQMTEKMRSIN